LVGHANHVEVIGTLGERPGSTVVIESPEQARELETDKPVAVITQTTLSLDDVAPIVGALEGNLGALRRPNADDICYATQNRQDAVKEMVAQGASLILVIGSESSAPALPPLSVLDVTNDVSQIVAGSGRDDWIAYVHPISPLSIVRVQERETGFFEDLEVLLERIVPGGHPARARLIAALLSPH